jgi:hypothetical protein
MDYIALQGLKNFRPARIAAYNAALVATTPYAGNGLKLYCIIHNKIFDDASRNAIFKLFEKNTFFQQFKTKYEMITVLCQEEPVDPMDFVRQNKMILDPILRQLNLDTRITENMSVFKDTINNNIVSILNYIESKETEIMNLFNLLNIQSLKNAKGGKTKRFRRKTKQSKRKNKITLGKQRKSRK